MPPVICRELVISAYVMRGESVAICRVGLTTRCCWEKILQALRFQRRPSVSGPVAQLGARFHGMEEVVGSIPTRSTKSLNKLDRASAHTMGVCVMVCVITRRFGAMGKGSIAVIAQCRRSWNLKPGHNDGPHPAFALVASESVTGCAWFRAASVRCFDFNCSACHLREGANLC